MAKSKVKMPKDQEKKCHVAIHTATAASAAAGASPIPFSDAIPIGAAQIAMIIALGKVFDITIGQAAAKSIAGVGLATVAGRTVVTSAFKMFPGIGTLIGAVTGAVTAAAITEGLGWLVADDFFRISIGENPEEIDVAIEDIRRHFVDLNK